ncbi:very-long-chain 3-oxoacyl-CoA reductase-like [Teleopsis dalmanni]|uniref:very-long-chain 3-oxoacyl-CoA reductase-like n=1 Tax=Teleopsis dalmanni TaxID=139649 RepID=UPI0018CDAA68|nr:very-long-chain 3-oxoacyl-CoA reductase-like [Teleopsis dalmanni]
MALDYSILSSICVGIVCVQIIHIVLPWLYANIIGPTFFGPKINLCQMGAWAVVTGATDGIGKAYAKALAKKGINVILISRSLSKLEAVAKELTDAYKVQIKIIDIDFKDGPQIYQKIEKNITGLDIGVLVNNVSICYPHLDIFIDNNNRHPEILRDIISVNIHSVTHMCALVLPNMIAKKKGVVINLSSITAVTPSALVSVYAATKAFVDKFSDELQTEYQSQGIIVQTLRPYIVATNMMQKPKPNLFVPSAEVYVDSALKTVGITSQTNGYFLHALPQFINHLLNLIVGRHITKILRFKLLKIVRKRALGNLDKNK